MLQYPQHPPNPQNKFPIPHYKAPSFRYSPTTPLIQSPPHFLIQHSIHLINVIDARRDSPERQHGETSLLPFRSVPLPFTTQHHPFRSVPFPFQTLPTHFGTLPLPFTTHPRPFHTLFPPFLTLPTHFSTFALPLPTQPRPCHTLLLPFTTQPSPFHALPTHSSTFPLPFLTQPRPFHTFSSIPHIPPSLSPHNLLLSTCFILLSTAVTDVARLILPPVLPFPKEKAVS